MADILSDDVQAPLAAAGLRGDRTVAAAVAGFLAVSLVGILARPLLPIDETRYLAVAWGMRLDGDWLVPHLNGAIYTHKPPLLFWLINLVWSLTGVSGTAARMVAPLFGALAIVATAAIASRLWPGDRQAGWRAALMLASFGAFAAFAGLTMFDGMLTASVALGVLALVRARHRTDGFVLFGLALALGVFSKGPVILLHLLPPALAMPLWAGTPVRRALAGTAVGLATALAVVALWLVPAILTGGPEYRDAVLWTQSAGRMVESFAHARPWWFYLAVMPLLLWPWGWSLAPWRLLAGRGLLDDGGVRLALIWIGAAVLLFSLASGKQPHYLLPVLPAAALLLARLSGEGPVRAPAAALPPLAAGLAAIAVAAGVVPLGHAAGLAGPVSVVLLAAVAMIALAVLAWRSGGAAIAAAGFGAVLVADLAIGLGAAGNAYDTAGIGRLLAPHDRAGVAVLTRAYHGEFTFAGRLERPVATLETPAEAEAWLAGHPGGALVARIDGPHPAEAPAVVRVFRDRDYGVWTSPFP